MSCACGSDACRGTIGDFADLPLDRRTYYLEQGVVAPYLIDQTRDRAA